MFRIEISDDRSPARRRADPVVAQAGVFAGLAPEELQPAEAGRLARAAEEAALCAAPAGETGPPRRRLWRASDILARLTALYDRLGNPFRPGKTQKEEAE